MGYVVKDKEDLEENIRKNSDKLVIIDFYAPWCGPCKLIAPKIDEYAQIYSETLIVLKVDVDNHEELAFEYNISSMPTFVFLKNGERIDSFSGANAEHLESKLSKYLEIEPGSAASSGSRRGSKLTMIKPERTSIQEPLLDDEQHKKSIDKIHSTESNISKIPLTGDNNKETVSRRNSTNNQTDKTEG